MADWYLLSIFALLLMGTQRFLYKVSAERKCNTAWTTFFFMSTVTLLSALFFAASKAAVSNISALLIIALLNSLAFLAGTFAHIEALKYVAAGVVYPLIRLDVVLVVIFSILFFGDRLSIMQITGILLAFIVLALLASEAHSNGTHRRRIGHGLVLIAIAVFSGALASITSKFAALHTNLLGFMAVSYFFATLLSLGIKRKFQLDQEGGRFRDAAAIGLAMGILNFGGFYAFLRALSYGPLSVIAPIIGMHFVIGIMLSVLMYKERLTGARMICVLLTIASIIFLRL